MELERENPAVPQDKDLKQTKEIPIEVIFVGVYLFGAVFSIFLPESLHALYLKSLEGFPTFAIIYLVLWGITRAVLDRFEISKWVTRGAVFILAIIVTFLAMGAIQ